MSLSYIHDEPLVLWSSLDETGMEISFSQAEKMWLTERVDLLKNDLKKRAMDAKEILSTIDTLQGDLFQLLEFAEEYSFKGIDANGFSTLSDNVVDFIDEIMVKDHLSSEQGLTDLMQVLKIFQTLAILLKRLHLNRKKKDVSPYISGHIEDQKSLLSNDWDEIEDILDVRQSLDAEFALVTEKFFCFWMKPQSKLLFQSLAQLVSFSVLPFLQKYKVFNKKLMASYVDKVQKNANFKIPIEIVSVSDTWSARNFFGMTFKNPNVHIQTFDAPSQGRWTIPRCGLEIAENFQPITTRHSIRCRLLTHATMPNTEQVLVLHLHGGGLVAFCPEFHEPYTQSYVARLEGAALLCPDYSLSVAYPIQFQEILDTYLWLVSGDSSVGEKLGFRPRKIVILADSAGATLTFGLLSLLKKIQDKDSSLNILFPKDLVFIYAAFSMQASCAPSRISSFFELLCSESNLMAVRGILAGIEGREWPKKLSERAFVRFFQCIKDDFIAFKRLLFAEIEEPWYRRNGSYDYETIKQIVKPFNNTYFPSSFGFQYERFSDTRLYLFTTNKCCFLDESIDVARLWKGPVELHVAKKLCHGFLHVYGEKNASKFSCQLLKKAVKNAINSD